MHKIILLSSLYYELLSFNGSYICWLLNNISILSYRFFKYEWNRIILLFRANYKMTLIYSGDFVKVMSIYNNNLIINLT